MLSTPTATTTESCCWKVRRSAHRVMGRTSKGMRTAVISLLRQDKVDGLGRTFEVESQVACGAHVDGGQHLTQGLQPTRWWRTARQRRHRCGAQVAAEFEVVRVKREQRAAPHVRDVAGEHGQALVPGRAQQPWQ